MSVDLFLLFIIVIRDDSRRRTSRVSSKINPLHSQYQREDQIERYPKPYEDVKYVLFNLFQSYGQVLQIVTKRNDKLRGQAFVVFREVAEASAARNNLNGYPIFGKPMVDIELTLENMLCS